MTMPNEVTVDAANVPSTKRARLRRSIAVLFGDTHIQSTIGLCPPRVELDDGGTYLASPGQKWIHANWLKFWETVRTEFKPQGGGKLYVVHHGDVVDGDHHETSQIITRNPATVLRVASDLLEPVRNMADYFFVVRGTESHAGKSASSEERIANDLGAERDEQMGTYSWWHLSARFDGALFDCAHHPPSSSSRPATSDSIGNITRYLVISHYGNSRSALPDVISRGHVHHFSQSSRSNPLAVVLPSWQLKTGYAHRRHTDSLADIGGVVCVIENGSVVRHIPLLYTAERRLPWVETNKKHTSQRRNY